MTFEYRLVFDSEDVLTLIFECKKCGGRHGVPVNRTIQGSSLIDCPYCNTDWLDSTDYVKQSKPFVEFIAALKELNRVSEYIRPGFQFRIEAAAPPMPSDRNTGAGVSPPFDG